MGEGHGGGLAENAHPAQAGAVGEKPVQDRFGLIRDLRSELLPQIGRGGGAFAAGGNGNGQISGSDQSRKKEGAERGLVYDIDWDAVAGA